MTGIDVDDSGATNVPGQYNDITTEFVEGLSENSEIFTDNGDDTATVQFCAQVGLFDGSSLVNYVELKETFRINLLTNASILTAYTTTDAGSFTDAGSSAVPFDGTLNAYFCNPTTKTQLTNTGATISQGSEISVCFNIPDGQFEIKDVLSLTVEETGGTPSMDIMSGGSIISAVQPYAEKTCTDSSTSDTNYCVVNVILKAEFYHYDEITLTGDGSVLLEVGDAPATRRFLNQQDGRSAFAARVAIDPLPLIIVEQEEDDGSYTKHTVLIYLTVIGVVTAAALVRLFMCRESKEEEKTISDDDKSISSLSVPEMKEMSPGEGSPGSTSTLPMKSESSSAIPETSQMLSHDEESQGCTSTMKEIHLDEEEMPTEIKAVAIKRLAI